jgi:hypothetical protein
MIQRINSLGRKRIPQACVVIEVFDGDPRTFDAEIDLSNYNLPAEAFVVIEATSAGLSTVQRFECGQIGKLVLPRNSRLDQLTGQNVFFSLKVIDRSEKVGRLLGVAENIRPEKSGDQTVSGRKGILPVERRPLGQQLWKLHFCEHDVFLFVNEDIPHLSESVRSDPVFYSLIYPGIVRQILIRAISESGDPEAQDDTWRTLWLSFARKIHPAHSNPPLKEDDPDEVDEWIEEVVDSFCDLHQLKQKYMVSGYGNSES